MLKLKNSTSEELCETRELLQNFEQRKLPKFVCGISIDNYENKVNCISFPDKDINVYLF